MNEVAFEEDPPRERENEALPQGTHEADALLLNIDGFEGPIDVLLELARTQKVDLTKISILQLARQYLVFVERAKALRLDLAAEYLVMAAWLAYLKSRLILPRSGDEEGAEPSGEAMAEALQFQLRRLEAIQNAAATLMKRPRLGQGVFARGMPEGLPVAMHTTYDVTLYELLKAYGDINRRKEHSSYELPSFHLMSMDDAVERLRKMLGNLPRSGPYSVWTTLQSFLPENITTRLYGRSALASTLTAGLELAKQGKVELRQDAPFKPIYLRTMEERGRTDHGPEESDGDDRNRAENRIE